MSRILIKIKNHKKKLCLILVLIIILVCGIVMTNYYLAGFALIATLGLMINFLTVKKMQSGASVFYAGSKIRNIDTLIIGEPCSLDELASDKDIVLQITAPGRSPGASYEILRHTFGILDEGCGEVVLVVKKGNAETGFSLFDIPYLQLSPISVKRLGLEGLQKKSKLPLVFAPIRTMQMLLSVGKNKKPRETVVPQEMLKFCQERNITIRCMAVDWNRSEEG